MSFADARRTSRRGAFTLTEVLVAVAIVGLVTTGGFRLIGISLRTLSEVRAEQELTSEARKIWLEFLTKEDMPDSGEKDGVKWSVTTDSVPVIDDMELTFRKLAVEYKEREMVLYLPENSKNSEK
jgi:prepilin-type N-terminal cleavage/methylation domain-containing protein